MKLIFSTIVVVFLFFESFSQTGTSSDPFTSLDQAAAVTTAGDYYFSISGQSFQTYVDQNGYILIASDNGLAGTSIPQGTVVSNSTSGILDAATLAVLTGINTTRISTSEMTPADCHIDVSTTNDTIASRIVSNTALHLGQADTTFNASWMGVNTIITEFKSASNTSPNSTALNETVFHPAGNVNGFVWIPKSSATGLSYRREKWTSGDVASSVFFYLWVRGDRGSLIDCPNCLDLPPTPDIDESEVFLNCTVTSVDLSTLTNNLPDPSHTLVWSTDNPLVDLNNVLTSTSVTAPGTYYAYYSNGTCVGLADMVEIKQRDPIVTSLSLDHCDSILVAPPTGGLAPYEYSIDGGTTYQTDPIFEVPDKNTYYTITVKDAEGCIKKDSIKTLKAIVFGKTITNATCFDKPDGEIKFNPSGGTGAGTITVYYKDDPTVAIDPFVAGKGSYTFVAYDANGCSVEKTFPITAPPKLEVGVKNKVPIACAGGMASFVVKPSGGKAPYEFSFNEAPYEAGVSDSMSYTNLAPGTYTVDVKDDNGCIEREEITFVSPDPIFFQGTMTQGNCNKDSGSIAFDPIGGTGTITLTLKTSGTVITSPYSDLAGTYEFTATDEKGCTKDTSIVITQPAALVLHQTVQHACTVDGSGSISFAPTGGDGNITVSHNGAPITSPFSATEGPYQLNMVDGNGCTGQKSVTVTEPGSNLDATLTQGPAITCNGGETTVSVTATGGYSTSYTYAILESSSTATPTYGSTSTFSNVTAGDYLVYIKDAKNCIVTKSISITEPEGVSIVSVDETQSISCNGGTAILKVTASGGSGTYEYAITSQNFVSTDEFTVTAALSPYTIFVKDLADPNCPAVSQTNIIVNEPDALVINTVTSTPINCMGENSTITVSDVSGGTEPYMYSIDGTNYQSENVFEMGAGDYTITVKDANDCETTYIVPTITEPSTAVVLTLGTITNPECFGANGEINFSATGGTGTIEYTVVGATVTSPLAAVAGTYTIVATDAGGCVAEEEVTLAEPAKIVFDGSAMNATCSNGQGQLILSATGGINGNLSFSVTDGSGNTSTETAGTLDKDPGTYTIVVTDLDVTGTTPCQTDPIELTIEAPLPLVVNEVTASTINCFGESSTIVVTDVTGGTSPYMYSIDGGTPQASNEFIMPANNAGESYTIEVFDSVSTCPSATYDLDEITQPEDIDLSGITAMDASCNGEKGKLNLNVTGNMAPYTYEVNGAPMAAGSNDVDPGTYVIKVFNSANCEKEVTLTVNEPDSLEFTSSVCFDGANGSITLNASGGVAPYLYSISGGSFMTANVFSKPIGTYIFIVKDAQECTSTLTVEVTNASTVEISNLETSCAIGLLTYNVKFNTNGGQADVVTISPSTYTASYNSATSFWEVNGITSGEDIDISASNACSGSLTQTVTAPSCTVDTCATYADKDPQYDAWSILDCDGDGNPNGSDDNVAVPTAADDIEAVVVVNPYEDRAVHVINILGNDDFLPNNDANNLGTTTITILPGGTATGIISVDNATGTVNYAPSKADGQKTVTYNYQVCNDASGQPVCSDAVLSIIVDGQPLSVDLISFEAINTTEGNLLRWKTANEENFDKYIVERKSSRSEFAQLAQVKGGQSEYTYLDKSADKGVNYYRLKMLNDDGSYNYSPELSVNVNSEAISINLFPNPVSGNRFKVENNFVMKGPKLFDNIGKSMPIKVTETSKYYEVETINSNLKGVYFFEFKANESTIRKRLIFNP